MTKFKAIPGFSSYEILNGFIRNKKTQKRIKPDQSGSIRLTGDNGKMQAHNISKWKEVAGGAKKVKSPSLSDLARSNPFTIEEILNSQKPIKSTNMKKVKPAQESPRPAVITDKSYERLVKARIRTRAAIDELRAAEKEESEANSQFMKDNDAFYNESHA